MKKYVNSLVASAVIGLSAISPAAYAGFSANVGFTSNYISRGFNFGEGGAYGGLDYSIGPFYVGTWVIDDGESSTDGLETDFYLGLAGENDFFSWDIGVITYQYTYTSTSETEVAASIGVSLFNAKVAYGNDDDDTVDSDYLYYELGLAGDFWSIKYGETDLDDDDLHENGAGFVFFDNKFIEVGFNGQIGGIDWALGIGEPFDEPDYIGDKDAYMFIDVSKTFDF